MMSDKNKSLEKDPAPIETPQGTDYKAQVNFYDCKGSGECMKACPEQAIEQGPERLPAAVCLSEGKAEMLPGKAAVIEDRCTGCGDCVPACPSQAIEMVPVSEENG
jgi:Pyruvate/2-oxoacid:ferredoxin oxidoreductase delta subunit